MNIYERAPEDVTDQIFDRRFVVSIQDVAMRSVAEVKMYGTYSSGDRAVDDALKNQWITVMLTIDEMVEKYKIGAQIRVRAMEDTKTIYEIITKHLDRMKYFLSYGLNIGSIPIEDLIELDKFAADIYPFAQPQFDKVTARSYMAEYMANHTRVSPAKIFNDSPVDGKVNLHSDGIVRINHDKKDQPEEHNSMADFLKEKLVNSGRFR